MGEFGLAVEEEGGGEVDGLGFGLVPKAVLTDVSRQVESIEQKRDLGVGSSRGASETPRQRDVSRMDGEALHEEEDDMEDFPTADQLRSMKIELDAVEAIDGDVTSQRDEYKNMVCCTDFCLHQMLIARLDGCYTPPSTNCHFYGHK